MIWQFVLASVALTLLPGPDILFVLTQSLTRGARAAFSVALGLCSGLVFHTAAVAFGVAILLAESPVLFRVLKYCGAAYLLYLGVRAVLASRKKPERTDDPAECGALPVKSQWALYRQGITMNLLNPKVLLFFLSFLPGFVDPEADSPTLYIVMLGAIFAIQALAVFSTVSLLGGWIGARMRIDRYMNSTGFAVVSAVLYAAIAVLIIW